MINKIQIDNSQKYTNTLAFKGKSKITQNLIEKSQASKALLTGTAVITAAAEIGLSKKKIYDDLDINEVKKDLETDFSISQLAKKYNISSTSMRNYLKENNLSTKDGEILKTITKEDLERLIQEGKSSKEIAQIYGLKHAGALTPLFKIFGVEAATAKKVENISENELVEYKKRGLTDTEISEQLHVAPRYIAERRNSLGIAAGDALKEYPEEEIHKLVEKDGLRAREVAQMLDIPIKKVAEIAGGMTPAQIFNNKKEKLIKFVNSLDEKDFSEKEYWLMQQKRGMRGPFKLTRENIELSKLILENEKLRKNNNWEYVFGRIAAKSRKNPSVYDDTVTFLKMILKDDKLNILKDSENHLDILLNQYNFSSKDILDIYKKIISDDSLVEAVKLSPGGFRNLTYIHNNAIDLIKRINENKDLINEKPLNFYIEPTKLNKYIMELIGNDFE